MLLTQKHATNILSPTYKIKIITLKTFKKLLKKNFYKISEEEYVLIKSEQR